MSVSAEAGGMPVLRGSAAHSFAYYGDRAGWGIALSVHRDSDALERSNWRVIVGDMAERFGPDGAEGSGWAIERMGHWAVGWIDYLLVRPGSAAEARALEWRGKLDDYPCADEEDYGALEWAEDWCVRCDRGTREDHPVLDRMGNRCPFRSAEDAEEIAYRWGSRNPPEHGYRSLAQPSGLTLGLAE